MHCLSLRPDFDLDDVDGRLSLSVTSCAFLLKSPLTIIGNAFENVLNFEYFCPLAAHHCVLVGLQM